MTGFIKRGLVAVGVLATVGAANAAAIDVSGVTSEITAQLVPIGLIGAGVMLVIVAIKAFKWVRAAMS